MKLKVTVNPNPFTSALTILIHGYFSMNVVIRLMNSDNAVISMAACILSKGDNNVQLNNLQRYARGRYFLEIKLLNGDLVQRIDLTKH